MRGLSSRHCSARLVGSAALQPVSLTIVAPGLAASARRLSFSPLPDVPPGSLYPPPAGPMMVASSTPSSSSYNNNRCPRNFFSPSPAPAKPSSAGGVPSDPKEKKRKGSTEEVSEHEYRLRVGRAVSLLRETLPYFLEMGLVDTVEGAHGSGGGGGRPFSSLPGLGGLSLPSLEGWTQGRWIGNGSGGKGKGREDERGGSSSTSTSSEPLTEPSDASTSIYHPSIAFVFEPPTSLSSPLTPQLCFHGRHLYLASAQLLRHALNAVFSEAEVQLERLHMVSEGGGGGGGEDGGGGGSPGSALAPDGASSPDPRSSRTDSLYVRLLFTALSRVSHAPHNYTVVFRYTFDPSTGLIIRHAVESIEPAPGQKIWAGLRGSWGRLRLAGAGQGEGGGGRGELGMSSRSEAELQHEGKGLEAVPVRASEASRRRRQAGYHHENRRAS